MLYINKITLKKKVGRKLPSAPDEYKPAGRVERGGSEGGGELEFVG